MILPVHHLLCHVNCITSRFPELCNLSVKQFLFDHIRMSLIGLRGETHQSQELSSLQAGRSETQM